ncbi:hypothetical protein OK016_05805 [Vibrio chagasii]|nr:hypothetical protein [Vibrio chagasii]
MLELLSPAQRPLQITQDLAGFWAGARTKKCKEMKGRYPNTLGGLMTLLTMLQPSKPNDS